MVAGSQRQSRVPLHQRKHSSSKTPNPSKDDQRSMAAASETPTKEAKSPIKEGADKGLRTRSSKRKSKDGPADTAGRPNIELSLDLPSVPSTQHLHQADIHLSSFFSINRPISTSTPIPPESSAKAFSSIFDAKSNPKYKPLDGVYAISSGVDLLEKNASNQFNQSHQQTAPEEVDVRQTVVQASSSNADQPTHLDVPAKTFHINIQELAKKFRPFVPPPAPVPLVSIQDSTERPYQEIENVSDVEAQAATAEKVYSTKLYIHEITYPNGQKIYKPHTTPIVEEPSPFHTRSQGSVRYLPPAPRGQPFLARMQERQLQYLDRLMVDGEVWQTISVKRQRKLKMKKHKYKKLMKRTKNLRRRLDRV